MAGIKEIARDARVKPQVIRDIFASILERVNKGEVVRITRFGVFKPVVYKPRKMETPLVNDGEPFNTAKTRALRFNQSQIAKRILNTIRRKKEKK